MTRRMRLTVRGAAAIRRWAWALAVRATLACLTYCGRPALGASATCTAPPPSSAPPAARAAIFARAVRTDITFLSSFRGRIRCRDRMGPPRRTFAPLAQTQSDPATTITLTDSLGSKLPNPGRSQDPAAKLSRYGTDRGQYLGARLPCRAVVGPWRSGRPVQSTWSNRPPIDPLGGVRPRCCQPRSFRHRPRAVRATSPSWIR